MLKIDYEMVCGAAQQAVQNRPRCTQLLGVSRDLSAVRAGRLFRRTAHARHLCMCIPRECLSARLRTRRFPD